MKVSSSQVMKNKFIPFNKITKHNSISGTKPINSKNEKFKIRGTNKILKDSSNYYSKANVWIKRTKRKLQIYLFIR